MNIKKITADCRKQVNTATALLDNWDALIEWAKYDADYGVIGYVSTEAHEMHPEHPVAQYLYDACKLRNLSVIVSDFCGESGRNPRVIFYSTLEPTVCFVVELHDIRYHALLKRLRKLAKLPECGPNITRNQFLAALNITQPETLYSTIVRRVKSASVGCVLFSSLAKVRGNKWKS